MICLNAGCKIACWTGGEESQAEQSKADKSTCYTCPIALRIFKPESLTLYCSQGRCLWHLPVSNKLMTDRHWFFDSREQLTKTDIT